MSMRKVITEKRKDNEIQNMRKDKKSNSLKQSQSEKDKEINEHEKSV